MVTDERREAIRNKLRECVDNTDTEMAHGDADQILCDLLVELGYSEIVSIYENVEKWFA